MAEIGEAQDGIGQASARSRRARSPLPTISPSASSCSISRPRPAAQVERRPSRGSLGQRRRAGPSSAFAPFDQHHGAVGDGERGLHVLLDQQDGDAACAHRLQLCRTPRRPAWATGPPRARPASARAGEAISARATASICRCPPDSRPAAHLSLARRGRGTARSIVLDRARGVGLRDQRRRPAPGSPRRVRLAKTFSVCGTKARPSCTMRCAGMRGDVRARRAARGPTQIGTSPADGLDQRGLARAVGAEHGRRSRPARRVTRGAAQDRQAGLVAGLDDRSMAVAALMPRHPPDRPRRTRGSRLHRPPARLRSSMRPCAMHHHAAGTASSPGPCCAR